MEPTILLRKDEMARMMERLAYQILERHGDCASVMLVGIQRRGADLARRLAEHLTRRLQRPVPLGSLDINLYRDDWTSLAGKPQIGPSVIPGSVDDAIVILVDDVLYTGRRPRAVELLVLVDRGHRELPIHADYVGRSVNSSHDEQVNVLLEERDGCDEVRLTGK